MRVSKEKAARNRTQILAAAARLFRENGIRATGVDSISEGAGLTHGAFYSQFESKEALTAEAIRLALGRSKRAWQRAAERKRRSDAFRSIVAGYLSPEHRDSPGRGCVVAALGPSIARQPRRVREAFTRELEDAVDLLARLVPGNDPSRRREDAIAAFACMTGALILARAVADQRFSGQILAAATKRVIRGGRRGR
jgi:TetR/AcrR family transcriptional regulator, transcriptional repressor for nem operon